MKQRIKRIITKKDRGNVTSLVFGQMFILLLVVWSLFTFKSQILSTMFNYIDDALTGATLGGALVNVEEYGKSNQLIIHNNEQWKNAEGNTATRGWEKFEADILLSELNNGSDIVLTYSALQPKKVLDIDKGRDTTGTAWETDTYIRRSASAMFGNLVYNLSNGKKPAGYNYDAINPVGSIGSLNTNINSPANQTTNDYTIPGYSADGIHIKRDALQNSFVGSYLVNDIEITRFDIYNVWKLNMAKKHVYQPYYSEWFSVKDDGTGVRGTLPESVSSFREWFIEKHYSGGLSGLTDAEKTVWSNKTNKYDFNVFQAAFGGSPDWAAFFEHMLKVEAHWSVDKAAFDAHASQGKLICYTNTTTTYQGDWSSKRVGFDTFYCNKNGNATVTSLKASEALKINNITKLSDGSSSSPRAPIYGWTCYSYKHKNSQYNYTTGTTYKDGCKGSTGSSTIGAQKAAKVETDNNKDYIKIDGGKMDGMEIMNTSVYVELTFTVNSLFPKKWYDMATSGMNASDRPSFYNRVTTARLIDIELNPKAN